jgi:hypothetical protein
VGSSRHEIAELRRKAYERGREVERIKRVPVDIELENLLTVFDGYPKVLLGAACPKLFEQVERLRAAKKQLAQDAKGERK